MNENSDTLYIYLCLGKRGVTVCLNRRAITGSFNRFDGSEEAMDQYFDVTRGRSQAREQEIRSDFAAGGARSRHHFGEDSYEEQNPSTWIDPDLMQD